MQQALAFDEQLGELVVTVRGTASTAGFERAIAEVMEHPQFRPGLGILFDDTELDLTTFTTAEIRDIAALAIRVAETLAPRAIAVIVQTPLAFGLARQWQSFAEPAGFNTAIFTSRAEALRWLRDQRPPASPATGYESATSPTEDTFGQRRIAP